MPARCYPFVLFVLALALGACSMSTTSHGPAPRAEVTWSSSVARAPLRDTARVDGVAGGVRVTGVLYQTPPCFGLAAAASEEGGQIVVRMTATQVPTTCATFAAGSFDYVTRVADLAPGRRRVEVVHRTVFADGRTVDARIAADTVDVR